MARVLDPRLNDVAEIDGRLEYVDASGTVDGYEPADSGSRWNPMAWRVGGVLILFGAAVTQIDLGVPGPGDALRP
jgi:hypothetical protein